MVCGVVLAVRDLVVGRGRVVRPGLVRQRQPRDRLRRGFSQHARVRATRRRARTSKSCRLRISSSGGTSARRSWRARSASVTATTTFWTVAASTAPRLQEGAGQHRGMTKGKAGAYCFSGGRLEVIASGGWIGSYSSLRVR
jgi:hypothetical protein